MLVMWGTTQVLLALPSYSSSSIHTSRSNSGPFFQSLALCLGHLVLLFQSWRTGCVSQDHALFLHEKLTKRHCLACHSLLWVCSFDEDPNWELNPYPLFIECRLCHFSCELGVNWLSRISQSAIISYNGANTDCSKAVFNGILFTPGFREIAWELQGVGCRGEKKDVIKKWLGISLRVPIDKDQKPERGIDVDSQLEWDLTGFWLMGALIPGSCRSRSNPSAFLVPLKIPLCSPTVRSHTVWLKLWVSNSTECVLFSRTGE